MSASVFPARAGMSLKTLKFSTRGRSVPRASGDEPLFTEAQAAEFACSPRERG